MKKMNLMMLITLLTSGMAHANYQCSDTNNQVSMTVFENHITHYSNTLIILDSPNEKTQYYGTLHSEGGYLFTKKVVEILSDKDATLTIVSKPKFCGRGSCDYDGKNIFTANLKIGETQTYFSCNETNP